MKPKKQLRWLLVLFIISKYVNSEYLNPDDIQGKFKRESENNFEEKTVNTPKSKSDGICFKQGKITEKIKKEDVDSIQADGYKVTTSETNTWRKHIDDATVRDVNKAQLERKALSPNSDMRIKIIAKIVTEGGKQRNSGCNSQRKRNGFNIKNSIQRSKSDGERKAMEIIVTARLRKNRSQRSERQKHTQRMENNKNPSISNNNLIKADRIITPRSDMARRTAKRFAITESERNKAYKTQTQRRIDRMEKQESSLSSSSRTSKIGSDRLQRDETRGRMKRRTDSQKSDIRRSKGRIVETPLSDITYRTEESFAISESEKNKAYRSQRERRIDRMKKQESSSSSNSRTSKIESDRLQRDETRGRMKRRTDFRRSDIRHSKRKTVETPDITRKIAKVFAISGLEKNMVASLEKERSANRIEHRALSSRSNIRQRTSEKIATLRSDFRRQSAEKVGIFGSNINGQYRKQKEMSTNKKEIRLISLRSDIRRKSVTVDALRSKKHRSYRLQIERNTGKMERIANSLRADIRTRAVEKVTIFISEKNKADRSQKIRSTDRIERRIISSRLNIKERASEIILTSRTEKSRWQRNIDIAERKVVSVTSSISRNAKERTTSARSQRNMPNTLQRNKITQKIEFRTASPESEMTITLKLEKNAAYRLQRERTDGKLKSSFYQRSDIRCKSTKKSPTPISKTHRSQNERIIDRLGNNALYLRPNMRKRSEIINITRLSRIGAYRLQREKSIDRTGSRSFSQKSNNERKISHRFAILKSEKNRYYRIQKERSTDRRNMSPTSDVKRPSNIIMTFRSERSTSTIRSHAITLIMDVRRRESEKVASNKLERNRSHRLHRERNTDRVENRAIKSRSVSKDANLGSVKHVESKPESKSNTVIIQNAETSRNSNIRKVSTIYVAKISETRAGRQLQKPATNAIKANVFTIPMKSQNRRSLGRFTISNIEENVDHSSLGVRKQFKLSSASNIRIRKPARLLNSRSQRKINGKFQEERNIIMMEKFLFSPTLSIINKLLSSIMGAGYVESRLQRYVPMKFRDNSFPTRSFIRSRIPARIEAKNELSQLVKLNERIVLSKKELCQDCWNSSISEKQVFMTSILKEIPVLLNFRFDVRKKSLNAGSIRKTSWSNVVNDDTCTLLRKVSARKTRNAERRLYVKRQQTKPLLKDSVSRTSRDERGNRIYERVAEKLRLQRYFSTEKQITADIQRITLARKSERRIALNGNQNQKSPIRSAETTSWFTVQTRTELRVLSKDKMQLHERNGRGFRGRRNIFKMSEVRAQSRMNEKSDHVYKNKIYFTTQLHFDRILRQVFLTRKNQISNQMKDIFDTEQIKLSNHRENTHRRLNSALRTVSARRHRLTEKHEYGSSVGVNTPFENYAEWKERSKLSEKNMLSFLLNLTLGLLILILISDEKNIGKSKSLTEILSNALLRTNVF